MKVFKLIILAILVVAVTSCNGDITTTNPSGPGYGLMSANINGNYWSATEGYAQSSNAFSLTVYGSYNQASYIVISLSNYSGPGTYTLGGFNTAIFYDGYGTEYDATSGTITVSSDINNSVQGYFYFSGIATYGGSIVSVSTGKFNLSR